MKKPILEALDDLIDAYIEAGIPKREILDALNTKVIDLDLKEEDDNGK